MSLKLKCQNKFERQEFITVQEKVKNIEKLSCFCFNDFFLVVPRSLNKWLF